MLVEGMPGLTFHWPQFYVHEERSILSAVHLVEEGKYTEIWTEMSCHAEAQGDLEPGCSF